MKTLSFKLPESLLEKLDAAARKRGENRSTFLREAIETFLRGELGAKEGTCLELAQDLAGSLKGTQELSWNKRRMNGYGQ